MLQTVINNVVVQILLGVGGMVFLICLGEALRNNVSRRSTRLDKEQEVKIKADFQKDIVALRNEVEKLRTIVLEHSMSLDNNVETLKHRMNHVESKMQQGVENRG